MAQHLNKAELAARLWSEIGKARTGMLGLVGKGAGGHFQPMSAFAEPDASAIYFFARASSGLARQLDGGDEAMFMVQAKDQEFQACVGGQVGPPLQDQSPRQPQTPFPELRRAGPPQ